MVIQREKWYFNIRWRIRDWLRDSKHHPICKIFGHKKEKPRDMFTRDLCNATDHRMCERCRFWEALIDGEWVDVSHKY